MYNIRENELLVFSGIISACVCSSCTNWLVLNVSAKSHFPFYRALSLTKWSEKLYRTHILVRRSTNSNIPKYVFTENEVKEKEDRSESEDNDEPANSKSESHFMRDTKRC